MEIQDMRIETQNILVSKRRAAEALSVSLRTVDNLIARRELPARRIGKRVLIPWRSLENFSRTDHATRSERPNGQ
jgi:excisionase family DNA binding protein